jgi:single-stranded DNA-binding protein
MPYVNQHHVYGHLGADATFVELPAREGQARNFVANFRVAATKRYSSRNGTRKERTTWFTVKLTISQNGLAFFTDKLKKGACVWVQGEPLVDEKVDGNAKHYYHYTRADHVEILGDPKPAVAKPDPADDEEPVPLTQCSDATAPPPSAPARNALPPARPAPPKAAQPDVQPRRVHELPDDAHSRFDTANW